MRTKTGRQTRFSSTSSNILWKQIKGCEPLKDEIAIYKRKTTKDRKKKSFKVLKNIISSYLIRTRREHNEAATHAFNKGLGADGVVL